MRSSALLHTLVARLQANDDVRAVWLAGSRGRGNDDEYSDIDLWIALDDAVIVDVVVDPLAWIHTIVPTIMHAVVPANGPAGGSFVGSWVPADDAFVQVDWYIAPASNASRDADTQLVFGDIPVAQAGQAGQAVWLADNVVNARVGDNLVLALQMVNNLVKFARRGLTWRTVEHARHANTCLANATWLLNYGTEPGYAAGKTTFLPEPVRNDAGGIRMIARTLLAAAEEIAARAGLTQVVAAPLAAMQVLISEWEHATFIPPEEYYRGLARRRLGAGVLITDAGGRVLLLETTYKQTYEIPGGACEAGESPRDTARREVREELGLELDIGRLLVFDHRSNDDPKGDAIMLVYDGGILEQSWEISVDGAEISSYRLVEPGNLEEFTATHMATRLRAALQARAEGRTIEIANEEVMH